MEDKQTAIILPFELQHGTLPSVELTTSNDTQWQIRHKDKNVGSSSGGLLSKTQRSKIPLPVSWSVETEDTALSLDEVGQGYHATNYGYEHDVSQGQASRFKESNYVEQSSDNLVQEFNHGDLNREHSFARYHGKYQSYDEMIANMDDSDPFRGVPPPSREKSNVSKRSAATSSKRPPRGVQSRNTQNKDPVNPPDKHHQKKKSKTPKTEDAKHHSDDLDGTFTIMHDNPMYDGFQSRERRESTGTFTIERSDSLAKLVHDKDADLAPSSVDISHSQQSNSKFSQTIQSMNSTLKKVRIDTREEANWEHTGKSIEELQRSTHKGELLMRQETCLSLTGNSVVDELNAFVLKHISHRSCIKYIRDLKKEGWCQCGRDYNWHVQERAEIVLKDTHQKWKPKEHSAPIHANSFGTICFNGFGQEASKNAPYVRVDYQTVHDLDNLWTLLYRYWNMPPPKLIISVTGGAKRFFIKNRLKSSFKRGLVNAATSTGAWIVTGGTNAGVMEFVGEAVRDYMLTTGGTEQKVVALGIGPWGCIDNKENLEGDEPGVGLFPANYDVNDLSPKDRRGVTPLDPNHTHFILVDDGTEGKFGSEIQLRTALEQFISAKFETGVAECQSVHVPVVLLVLEGGENTLETTVQAARQSTPIVVIQGSGRAADFISYAYKATKAKDGSEDRMQSPVGFDEEVEARAGYMFDWSREKDPEVKQQKIRKCVKNVKLLISPQFRNLLTVFYLDDVDTHQEIDQAILYALLKAKRSDALIQLNLALAWNRCDMARQEIFNMENRTRWQTMQLELHAAMFTALSQDRSDFVQLFLDNGVDLKRFLTVRCLRDLYKEVLHDKYSGTSVDLLRHMFQNLQQTWRNCCGQDKLDNPDNEANPYEIPWLLSLIGDLVNFLVGDQQGNMYKGARFKVAQYLGPDASGAVDGDGEALRHEWAASATNIYGDPKAPRDLNTTTSRRPALTGRTSRKRLRWQPDFEHPERELFLWAVLFNRMQLASFFWRISKDHIGGGLMASSILKSLADEADKEEEMDLSQELLKNAQEFEVMATGVLGECYQRDKVLAHKLLVRELPLWGCTTTMAMADNGELMDFMEHSCVQTKLNKIWKGKMTLYTSVFKIVAGLLFFPFIIPSIKFTTNEFPEEQSLSSSPNEVRPTAPRKDSPPPPYDEGDPQQLGPIHKGKKKRLTQKLYRVGLCGCCTSKDNSLTYCKAIYYYHTAPLVKFCYHTASYLIFLALFSYFMLTDLRPTSQPNSPSVIEYIVWGWAATLLIEELRQIATRDPTSVRNKLAGYFANVWNQFDQAVYLLLIVSIILRYTLPDDQFVWARSFYAITLCLFFLRFMQTFYVEKNIGPKIIMIRRMLTDLAFFIMILAVFLLAYGVAAQALRFPNSEPSWNILKEVFYMPYWQMYGELFLEEMEGILPGCTDNQTEYQAGVAPRCPEHSGLVMLFEAIYMLLVVILLLNLLIAMFSYTFERVQANSEKVWRFYRYGLIYEYFDRPTLAPPLIILSHCFRFVKFVIRRCKDVKKVSNDFKQVISPTSQKKLTAFEHAGMENFLLRRQQTSREHIDAKVTSSGEKMERIINDMEQLKEQFMSHEQEAKAKTSDELQNTLQLEGWHTHRAGQEESTTALHGRITVLEDQLGQQSHQMAQVISLLQEQRAPPPAYPPSTGAYPPSTGAYPPPTGAYPPPTGAAYPPPTGAAYPPPTGPGGDQQTGPRRRAYMAPHPQIEIQDYMPGQSAL